MVNFIIRWCLNNRFLVVLAALVLLGAGYYCLTRTPIDAIPDIGEKQVIVLAEWPGRSPQDVEDQVTYPLTVTLQGTPHVKTIRSFSGFGFSMVYVIIHDDADYYWARSRVLERMNVAAAKLPAGVVPVLGPDATALGQVYWYTLEADGADVAQLRSLQDWYVRYQLQSVEGVSEVASVGGYVKQYQIDVFPERLQAHRVSLLDVYTAVRKSNIDVGAKVVENAGAEFFIRGAGFIRSVADIENIVIRQEQGTPILVKNVAKVQLGPEFRRGGLDKGGREAVGGVVTMRYGENPLEVIDRVKARIAQMEPGLRITLENGKQVPVHVVPFYDRTGLINETMATLRSALTEEAIIAAVVVIIFLLHIRSSLAILPTLPLSVAASFIVMYLMGVDSNIMSLAGIAIAIGDVADMGILMTENIYRRLAAEPHRPRGTVIYEAAVEVGRPMLTAVTNTIICFIPVFALTEESGKLFTPLAYTKTFAIGASVVLALTLVPVLCGMLLRKGRWSRPHAFWWAVVIGAASTLAMLGLYRGLYGLPARLIAEELQWTGAPMALAVGIMAGAAVYRMGRERLLPLEQNAVARGINAVFRPALRWTLNHKGTFLAIPITLVLVALLVWKGFHWVAYPLKVGLQSAGLDPTESVGWRRLQRTFPGLGEEFMPPLDEGSLLAMPSLLPSASLTEVQDVIARQNRAMLTVPEVQSAVGKYGRAESALDPAPIGMIETIIMLKPESEWRMVKGENGRERRITKAEILEELKEKTAIPGVLPSWLQPIETRIVMLQSGIRAMMGVKVSGSDPKEIERICLQIEKILNQVPGATDVLPDRIVGKPYLEYDIDRVAAARYGVSVRDIQDVIEIAIGGETLTSTVEGRERYSVRVRYPRELRERFEDLERVLVPTSDGAHIPISQVAKIRYTIGPQELKSENGLLVGYVTLNTRTRDEVGLVRDAERLLQEEKRKSDKLIKDGRSAEATLVVPPGYHWDWVGRYQSRERAMNRLVPLALLVLLAMCVTLYLGLGKWWLVLIVLFGIAASFAGGFVLLAWWGVNTSVAVWVGFIALFGVADDCSVVMLSFLEDKFKEETPKSIAEVREMVVESALTRVRPLLMTTATTVFGLLPIFLTHGRGSDVMQPMAIPMVGGMAVQLIAFLLAPCLYALAMEWKLRRQVSALREQASPPAP